MNRRNALKNLAIVSGSLITLPAWMGCGSGDKPGTHLSSFSTTEQKIIAGIADTIIPAGNTIGALSMGVDKFLQKFIDDCLEKEVQDNVKTQLKELDESAKKAYKKSFTGCEQLQRHELLQKFSTSPNIAAKDFFTLMRSESIRGFITSKQIMQQYLNYKIAPGHYYGCVELKS